LEDTGHSASGHPAQGASLLGTDKDGEAFAALTALKRALRASGLDHRRRGDIRRYGALLVMKSRFEQAQKHV
jgi:hypothetical protein